MSKRPNILALASKISLESMTYTGITYNDCEYKILEPIVDDDMCAVMMKMHLEKTIPVEELAKKCKKEVPFVQEQIDKLCKAGVVRSRTENGVFGYYYPIWVPGIMEGVMSNKENCEKYPVLGECFEEYTSKRLEMLVPTLNSGKMGMSFMRVMPVMSAIENNSHVASYDELTTLIEKATAISVGPCSCRRSRRLMGEGCGHLEDDMCIYLNDNAISFSNAGAHRLITKEECYEILKRAEDNGLVHEINQTPGFEDATAICNCCGCSCYALRIAEMFRSKNAIRSNFTAKINKDNCVACGQCVENCQTNAIRLGQKCSSVDPHVSDAYDSDQAVPWDKKSYNIEYRTNRSDVMETGTSPCKSACPAHIAVQGYLKLASQGRYSEALELIKKENPFPAVCGRICNKPCELACSRKTIDEAVAIDDIKKFIAEKDLNPETRFVPARLNQTGKEYPEKIAVIGAGPAGLSAAYYLRIKGYPVTVFEKEEKLGGMLTFGIPSFRLEKDVINAEIDILKEMGIEFKTGVEVGKEVTLDALRAEGYKAFYLAIGAQKGALLGIPGEDLKGVYSGIDFLRDVNLGKEPKLGKKTVVIGGGNVAIDVARTAVRLGSDVTVVYRRKEEDMPADPEEVAEAKAEGVKFLFEHKPLEILGKTKVTGLKCEGDECKTDTVIAAIGQKINLEGFAFETGAKGNVLADAKTYQTSVSDVFAGGDVVTGPKFAIDAIAAGKEAAVSIHRYVHPGQTLLNGRDPRDYKPFDLGTLAFSPAGFDNTPRQHALNTESDEALKSFRDLRGTLTEEQIKKEADRCLGCGCAVIDEDLCVGCGICTTKCKFDAIHLEKTMDTVGTPYFKTLLTAVSNAPAAAGRLIRKKIGK